MAGIPIGSSRIYTDGKVTLPKKARSKLEVSPGDTIFFAEDEETGRIYLVSKLEE